MIITYFFRKTYQQRFHLGLPLWSLFLFSHFLLTGCADIVKPVPEDPNAIIALEQNEYLPLKVGNAWTYQYTKYYSSGANYVYTSYLSTTNDTTLTYKGRKYQCVQFNVFSPDDDSRYVYYWSNSKEVLAFNDFGAMRYAARQVVMRQPIQAGDSLEMEFAAIYGNSLEKATRFAQCVMTSGSIDTPAGRFQNCIVIRFVAPSLSDIISDEITYYYFARGVGRVAMLIKSPSTRNGVTTERTTDEYLLKSYSIVR
jgi:hypothetical protein